MVKYAVNILSSIIISFLLLAYVVPLSHLFALEDSGSNTSADPSNERSSSTPPESNDTVEPQDSSDSGIAINNEQEPSTKQQEEEAEDKQEQEQERIIKTTEFSATSADTTPPAKVGKISVKVLSGKEASLKWSEVKDKDLNHYNIYRGLISSFKVSTGETPPTGTSASPSYSFADLNPSTKYYIKIAAVDDAGNIGKISSTKSFKTKSSPTSSSLKKVTGVSVSVISSTQLNIKWTAIKGTDHYNVYSSTSSGFTVTPGVTAPVGTSVASSFSLTGLKPATTYYVKVAVVDSAGNIGPLSSTKSGKTKSDSSGGGGTDTTPPAQVIGLQASTASSSQINLQWSPSSAPDLNQYLIYRSTTSGFTVTPGVTAPVGTSTANSYSSTGLSASTTYYYKVAAKDNAGNIGPVSSQASATTSGSASGGNMYDDFEGATYTISDGQKSPNGKWLNRYTGFGQMGVKTENGKNIFYEYPQASTQTGETHASLALSTQKFSNAIIEFDMKTDKQLRLNSAPNTWESAWVMFRFVDDFHHYYFVLKTNGIEFGKKDTACHCEEQIFLKTGSSPKLELGSWAHVKISSIGKHFTIWVNGVQVVDMDDPSYSKTGDMSSGFIGLYNEDASVAFDNVNITPQ